MNNLFLPYLNDNARAVAQFLVGHWDADPTFNVLSLMVMRDSGEISGAFFIHPSLSRGPQRATKEESQRLYSALVDLANLGLIELYNNQVILRPQLKAAVYHEFRALATTSGEIDTKLLADLIGERLLPAIDQNAAFLHMSVDDLRNQLNEMKGAQTPSEKEQAVRNFFTRIGMTADVFAVGQAALLLTEFIRTFSK